MTDSVKEKVMRSLLTQVDHASAENFTRLFGRAAFLVELFEDLEFYLNNYDEISKKYAEMHEPDSNADFGLAIYEQIKSFQKYVDELS